MTEASQRLQQDKLRTTLHFATITRARQVAMNAAKRRLQVQGLRVSEFTHRELVLKAAEYLAQHRGGANRRRFGGCGAMATQRGLRPPCTTHKSCTTPEGLNHLGFSCADIVHEMGPM
jgi:hypothetical protein